MRVSSSPSKLICYSFLVNIICLLDVCKQPVGLGLILSDPVFENKFYWNTIHLFIHSFIDYVLQLLFCYEDKGE